MPGLYVRGNFQVSLLLLLPGVPGPTHTTHLWPGKVSQAALFPAQGENTEQASFVIKYSTEVKFCFEN